MDPTSPKMATLHRWIRAVVDLELSGKDLQLAARIKDQPYREGGILPSEAFLFCLLCHWQKIDLCIESGRLNGFSTRRLIDSLSCPIITIEKNKRGEAEVELEEYLRERGRVDVTIMNSKDGLKEVPGLISKLRSERTAVLLDGPKGTVALDLAESISDRVVFTAIHDLSKRHAIPSYVPNPSRAIAEGKAYPLWFSDDEAYIKTIEHLDRAVWDFKDSGYESRNSLTAVGFTLTIIPGKLWSW